MTSPTTEQLPGTTLAAPYAPALGDVSLTGGAIHLAGAAAFVFTRAAEGLYYRVLPADVPWRTGPPWWVVLAYVVIVFAMYMALDALVGRLLTRGEWSWRRWAARTADHGVPFVVGSCLVVMTQVLFERRWLVATSVALLVLFALAHAAHAVLAGAEADDRDDAVTWRTTLLAYAWALAGLALGAAVTPGRLVGTATYVGWLMMTMSTWAMLTLPAGLAFARTRPAARHALRLSMWTPQLLWRRPAGW